MGSNAARDAIRELIRTAALEERERGEAYRRLGAKTDREVEQELHPKLARVYVDELHAARVLRMVLLKVVS
jgi:hypothetical protein